MLLLVGKVLLYNMVQTYNRRRAHTKPRRVFLSQSLWAKRRVLRKTLWREPF
jgi:hypothetical protein